MTHEGYEAFEDPYCYANTFVLKNRAGLRDAAELEGFELEMSALRADEPLPEGEFDTAHYRAVHHHLFQDVYDWSGEYRTVRTAKDGNAFCYPEYIAQEMERLFPSLQASVLDASTFEDFAALSAEFLGELNAIHPFREGNGRSQLSFLHLIGLRAGYELDLSRVERETFLPAMIASFDGELQLLTSEIAALRRT